MRPFQLARLWLNLRDYRFAVLGLLTVVVCIVFVALENRSAMLKTITNDEKLDAIPDAHMTGYDPGWLQMYLSRLTPAGRDHYVQSVMLIDCFFPLIYCCWFCVALSLAYSNLGPLYIRFRFVLFLPLLAVLFDYLENFMLFLIISEFKNGLSEQKADIASVCTQLKWCMILTTFIAIAIGIATSIRYVRRTRLPIYRPK